jgi:K+-transporting ATPase ATPase C chain
MKQNLRIALLMTLLTTVLFGLLYPLAVTGLGQLLFPSQANGGLIVKNGRIIGSRLIGQPFSSDSYFHGRPSATGNGYDPVAAGGGASHLGPTN